MAYRKKFNTRAELWYYCQDMKNKEKAIEHFESCMENPPPVNPDIQFCALPSTIEIKNGNFIQETGLVNSIHIQEDAIYL